MPRRPRSLLRGILLALLLATAACAAPAPPSPTASATPVRTVTPSPPPPTAAPSPTPVDPAALAEELLRTNPDRRCGDERSLYCSLPYSVRIFEYLREYPQSPQRMELTERVIDLMGTETGGRLPLDWFVDRWLDEALRQPIAAADGRLPAGLADAWQPHGTIQVTDLDADTIPDYLVAFHIGPPQTVEREGGLGWIHRVADSYQIERLPTLVDSRSAPLEPEILAVQDVNGDGRTDVVYQMTICGASHCFEHLHVFSWRAGAWWDLLPAAVNTVHRGWTVQDLGGGVAELIGFEGGGGMSGPSVSYAVYFAPINGEFAPVRVSSSLALAQADDPPRGDMPYAEIETDLLFLSWSYRLTYSRRLTESLEFIAPVAERATLPEMRGLSDYRPYARLRLGMAQLLLGDVAAAHREWQRLEQQFPDSVYAEAARQLLPLARQREDVFRVCIALPSLLPDWQRHESGDYDSSAFRWKDQCDPRVLLPLLPWTRDEPLTRQLERVGLNWQLLSADYDLNRDQIADLIGVLDYGGARTPWAWLSAEDQYRPLFAPQGFPLGATGTEQAHEYEYYQHYQDVRVSDLDANGRPELLLFAGQELVLMEWSGDRFRIQREDLAPSPPRTPFKDQGKAEALLAEPQADGSSRLRARMVDAQGQSLGDWVYALQDGELRRVEPPVEAPLEVRSVIEVLFGADDPRRALQMLDRFVPVEPAQNYWRDSYLPFQQEAADYLRGLALAYTGDEKAARAAWRDLAQRAPDSTWAPLAEEKLPYIPHPPGD